MKDKKRPGFILRISMIVRRVGLFVTEDIWKISDTDVKGIRFLFISLIKTLIISVRRFTTEQVQTKASALTYNTLLAIVPVLTLFFVIARGFGLETLLENQLFEYLPAQRETLTYMQSFVQKYLDRARNSGAFVGIGVVLLLWTVISMVNNIEAAFNQIWQIKKARTFYRKITDYTSLFLILPVLMICSSGLSLYLTTFVESSSFLSFVSPFLRNLIEIGPYVITCLAFTGMYIFIPNTKVKFGSALFAGVLCGTAFQVVQYFYMNGQLWVSKYNAIYGGLAFLPLLLLWLQLSWLICLFGAVVTYSAQNIRNYDFEQDTQHISRRYRDFLLLAVATVIVNRFQKGLSPYTIRDISYQYHIPTKLTGQLLNQLLELGIISETPGHSERETAYQPAIDIQQLSVGMLLQRLDEFGSENFKVDRNELFREQWETLIAAREAELKTTNNRLLKDFGPIEFNNGTEKKQKRGI